MILTHRNPSTLVNNFADMDEGSSSLKEHGRTQNLSSKLRNNLVKKEQFSSEVEQFQNEETSFGEISPIHFQ
jgi:cell shape-determining protein MreC